MLSCRIQKVVVAEHSVDFRKRFNGLLGECYKLGVNPYEGICVVFVKSDRTQIRAIVGDEEGLFLVCRRFDRGSIRLSWLFSRSPEVHTITQGELSLLLEGAEFVVHKRVRKWKKKND